MYGSDLMVAPITTAMDNVTGLTNKTIWIPKVWITYVALGAVMPCCPSVSLPPSPLSFLQTIRGSYMSWFSGEMFTGGDVINRNYTLSEMPLFVRSGSIIPMRTNDFGRFGYLYQCNTYCSFDYQIPLDQLRRFQRLSN